MINLVSRCNNFCEKRDVEMRYTVTCPSTPEVFLNMHVHMKCKDQVLCFSVPGRSISPIILGDLRFLIPG